MLRIVAKRLAILPIVLIGMSIITFSLTHLVPGDPARAAAGPNASKQAVETIREEYGFDKPLVTQYADYMSQLVRGDMGQSLVTRRPVTEDLKEFFPATAELTVAAMFIVLTIGLPLGLMAGMLAGKLPDALVRLFTIIAVSIPVFWLGILFQMIFYGQLGILPAGGRIDVSLVAPTQLTGFYIIDSLASGDTVALESALKHLILPAVALAAGSLAVITRMLRSTVVDVRDSDHVRTAESKGLRRSLLVRRHIFRNSLVPVTTVVGLQVGVLLAGSILVEVVFSWPGIGRYAVQTIQIQDYNGIMGVTLLIALIYVLANLIVDLLYLMLDPRTREAAGSTT